MMHPDTELRLVSPVVGSGVFAKKRIPRGTVTWRRDSLDRRFSPSNRRVAAMLRNDAVRPYLYTDGAGYTVLLWDHGRFINHSCNPNVSGGIYDDIAVAIRDIEAGEELTEDYCEFTGFVGFSCHCGAPNCRGRVEPLQLPDGDLRQPLVLAALEAGRVLPQALGLPRGRRSGLPGPKPIREAPTGQAPVPTGDVAVA